MNNLPDSISPEQLESLLQQRGVACPRMPQIIFDDQHLLEAFYAQLLMFANSPEGCNPSEGHLMVLTDAMMNHCMNAFSQHVKSCIIEGAPPSVIAELGQAELMLRASANMFHDATLGILARRADNAESEGKPRMFRTAPSRQFLESVGLEPKDFKAILKEKCTLDPAYFDPDREAKEADNDD